MRRDKRTVKRKMLSSDDTTNFSHRNCAKVRQLFRSWIVLGDAGRLVTSWRMLSHSASRPSRKIVVSLCTILLLRSICTSSKLISSWLCCVRSNWPIASMTTNWWTWPSYAYSTSSWKYLMCFPTGVEDSSSFSMTSWGSSMDTQNCGMKICIIWHFIRECILKGCLWDNTFVNSERSKTLMEKVWSIKRGRSSIQRSRTTRRNWDPWRNRKWSSKDPKACFFGSMESRWVWSFTGFGAPTMSYCLSTR